MSNLFFILCIRIIEKEDEAEKETADDSVPKLDLKFKDGQTIKVNLNIAVCASCRKSLTKHLKSIFCPQKKSTSRPKTKNPLATGILLPPPPSSSNTPTSRNSLTGEAAPVRLAADEQSGSGVADKMNDLSVGSSQKSSDWSQSAGNSSASGWAQF